MTERQIGCVIELSEIAIVDINCPEFDVHRFDIQTADMTRI